MFTTTTQDAEMVDDTAAVWRESVRGAGRLRGRGSRLVNRRREHKHNNRDNESLIPNRVGTSQEAADRRALRHTSRVVRGSLKPSTTSPQSHLEREQAAAPEPPRSPKILDILE